MAWRILDVLVVVFFAAVNAVIIIAVLGPPTISALQRAAAFIRARRGGA